MPMSNRDTSVVRHSKRYGPTTGTEEREWHITGRYCREKVVFYFSPRSRYANKSVDLQYLSSFSHVLSQQSASQYM